MNSDRWFVKPGFACVAAVGLLLVAVLTGESQAARRTESFVVYTNAGVAFPSGEGANDLKTGLFAGGGLAVGLGKNKSISGELGLHFDFYRFPRKQTSDPFQTTTSESYTTSSITGRLRFGPNRQLRPYALLGLGLYDIGGLGISGTASIGAGADLAFGRRQPHLVFFELRLISGSDYDIIRIGAGLRLG